MKIDSRRFAGVLAVSFALLATLAISTAAIAQKKVVKTEDDLPRFNYPIAGTATALLQSDDATFNAFAAKVKTDVDSVLTDYDIQDHATMRGLLNVRLALQLLANDDKAALATLPQLRDLEDKPDAKLLSGLAEGQPRIVRHETGQPIRQLDLEGQFVAMKRFQLGPFQAVV